MKKLLSILIISSLFLVSCGNNEISEKKYYKTYTVGQGYISSKDSILETVEGLNVSDLSFKNPGRISQILVKKGDIVKSGQILATLTNEEANINFNGAKNILNEIENMGFDISSMGNNTEKIKSSLSSLYDGKIALLENDYEKSKIGISLAQKDLDLAKSNLDNTTQMLSGTSLSNEQKIKQAENALAMAKNNLDNSKTLLESDRLNVQKNALNSLANAYIIARNARDYVDTILGVTDTNKNKNDSFKNYLGAKNSNTKIVAESSFLKFNREYEKTYKLYTDSIVNKTDIPKDVLLNVLNNALTTLEDLRQNLHDTKDVLDDSITSSTFTDDTLNGMQNQISTLLGNLESAILSPTGAGVKGGIEAIESFDNNYNLKIKQLEDAVDISTQDVNLTKTGKDISSSDISKNLESLKTNISVKEDSLSLAKIGEEEALKNIELTKQEKISKLAEIDTNLSQIKSNLSQTDSKKAEAQMNTNMAVNSIESGVIKAPFDGIILEKNFDIGGVVGAGTPIFKISSNDGKFIKTFIDNTIYGLSKGNEINLKGEKDSKTFTGIITNIDNIQDLSTKKNYTEIQINNENVNIGDRLILLIGKQKQEKQIIIPLNSIINKYSEPGVYMLQNGYTKFQIVKIKEADDNFVAIDGLKVGDQIIIDGKDNILDGEKLD